MNPELIREGLAVSVLGAGLLTLLFWRRAWAWFQPRTEDDGLEALYQLPAADRNGAE